MFFDRRFYRKRKKISQNSYFEKSIGTDRCYRWYIIFITEHLQIFLKTCSLLIKYSIMDILFLCAITCHYMPLYVYYVIYNRLNNVYTEIDSQVWTMNN